MDTDTSSLVGTSPPQDGGSLAHPTDRAGTKRTRRQPLDYGFTCPFCRTSTDFHAADELEATIRATDLGWVIGHLDGQGMYACPDCRACVFDPHPIASKDERERYARRRVRKFAQARRR